MIENKNILVILSLVVIASGCSHTATSSTATSDSVSIQNFSAFPSDVINNQQVRLTLTLINDGDATAENVQARLFNVPFSGDNSWDLNGERSISFGTLEEADEENNLPAREANQYWTLESPSLSDGVTIPYQFLTHVYYKYSTQGTTSVTLMNQQRFREQGNAERPTLDTTNGPIQMEIRTRSPIVFYPEDGSNRNSEMCVIVTNEGTGTPFIHSDGYNGESYDVDEEISNKVKLRVRDQGRISFSPSDEGDNSNTAIVDMFGNRGISCFTISVNGWESGVGPQEEVPIVLEADYGYYKETSTSVTVTGNERFSSGGSSTDSSDSSDSTDSSSSDDESSDDYQGGEDPPSSPS